MTTTMPLEGHATGDRVGSDGVYHALPDPIVDRVFSVTMALAAEVWTVRDRLRLMESALEGRGISVESLLQASASDAAQLERMRADRDAFIERVFRAISPGPQPEAR